jgi:hypothetical protein
MIGLRPAGVGDGASSTTATGCDGVAELEPEEELCKRELTISKERESRAGCRYPSNQRLKHES